MLKALTGTAEAWMVWAMAYLFFVAGLASNLSAAHDSINYLLHISRADHLFHQHHLLYHFFAHQWLIVVKTFIPRMSEHFIIESFTALWGSGALAVCYLFFTKRFGHSRFYAAAATAVIAFCYGTWFYSTNIEVYAPPLFFVLLALYRMTSPVANRGDVIWIGVIHAAAILFHQVNVLLTPVVLLWIFSQRGLPFMKSAIKYFVVMAGVAGLGYFIVGWFVEGHRSYDQFVGWLLGYTVGHNYWQPLSIQTPFKVLAGFGRAFIGGQFFFQLPPVSEYLGSSFSGHALEDEMFLTRMLPPSVAWGLSAVSIGIGITIVVLIVHYFRSAARNPELRSLRRIMIAALVVYSLFFTFWMPEIVEFWIIQMVIVWILLLGHRRVRTNVGPSVAVPVLIACALFVVNYTGSIHWLGSFDNDWYYQQTMNITPGKGDLVIVKDKWILKDYVRYFHNVEVIASDENVYSQEQIARKVDEVVGQGGRVFVNEKAPDGRFTWSIIRSY